MSSLAWWPFWVARAVSSACVLSFCPVGISGSLWLLIGLCPQPVSSACVLPSLYDAVKHVPGRSDHFWPLALIWAVSCFSGSLWPLFGLCPQLASSACVLRVFLGRSGPYVGCVLGLCPQLVSCGPFWVALALIWVVSSACDLSLFLVGLSGSLWPLFGLCPHPASSACMVAFLGRSGCVLGLCPQPVSYGHFGNALALIWAVSSACDLSLCPAIIVRRRETRAGPVFVYDF